MGRLALGEKGSDEAWRRLDDFLDRLLNRKEPRSFTVQLAFGSTPVTTLTQEVTGLGWITSSHQLTFTLRSQADLTAGLQVAVGAISPGKGFTLHAASTTGLTGTHVLGCIAV